MQEDVSYQWSSGFSVADVGQITLQMRPLNNGPENIIELATQPSKTKNVKIDRRLHKNTVFIIIEEEKDN